MTSITQRWLRGGLLVTVLALAIAEGVFLYTGYQNLYGGVERAMLSRFSTIEGRLQATGTAGSESDNSAARAQALRRTVEQFDEKDKFEFMLLGSGGVVLATSSGNRSRSLAAGNDLAAALNSASGTGTDTFRTEGGERVMAVTALVPYAAGSITAMRLVTSLTLADGRWRQMVTFSVGLAAAALLLSISSGVFFIRSIVRPLGQVEATATRIAHGDLQTRLPDTRYNDEIGRLCATINQMAADLARTEQLKNEFISSVSHELRTPLTSIKGWVETVATLDPGDESYRRGLDVIRTETDRLYTMVEELLDFSRLQSGGVRMNCTALDLVAEVTDAVLFVEARAGQEGLTLRYEEPPEPYPVWADAGRLRQVLVNILDNAIKYSDPGGAITLTLSRSEKWCTVAVKDEGRGIPPEDLAHVRDRFFKGRNAVRGSGIGLAVVQEIVTQLGGGIDIQSTLGQGTTVSVSLPVHSPGAAPAVPAAAEIPAQPTEQET